MKKTCLYLFIILFPASGMAQWEIGEKLGYTYYTFIDNSNNNANAHEDAQYQSSHSAFRIALFLRERSTKIFTLGYEAGYSYRSFRVKEYDGGLGGGSWTDLRYSLGTIYAEIQPTFTFGSKVKFFFYPGLCFGFLLHSSVKGTSQSWSMADTTGNPVSYIDGTAGGRYPKLVFGLEPGFGVEYKIAENLNMVCESSLRLDFMTFHMLNVSLEAGIAYTLRSKEREKVIDRKGIISK
jgi:hypothetical protein